jgi:hypothetical protein
VRRVRAEFIEEFARREAYRRINAAGDAAYRRSINQSVMEYQRGTKQDRYVGDMVSEAVVARKVALEIEERKLFEEHGAVAVAKMK